MKNNAAGQRFPDASFHDIGKIVNWDRVGLRRTKSDGRSEPDPHEFQKCIDECWNSPKWGVDPSAPAWQSILTWHPKWTERYPGSLHRWHLKTADWLASGYARGELADKLKRNADAPSEYSSPRWGRFCLWRAVQDEDPRLDTEDELKQLVCLLNTCSDWASIEERYGDRLLARAEEAMPGANVTSVLSHCRAVGKLARVLAKTEWQGADPRVHPKQKTVRALKYPPTLIVSHLRLGFRQRPFRARDLGVFGQMENELSRIVDKFADNVLTAFGFECVAAFESRESRTSFLRILEEAGFSIEEQCVDKPIPEYLSAPQGTDEEYATRGLMMVIDEPWRTVYVEQMPARIDLPICEGCQTAAATKHWPKDHLAGMAVWSPATLETLRSVPWREISLADIAEPDADRLAPWIQEWGEEDLCERCFRIRRDAPSVDLLRDWEGDVVYLRIALDLERLAGHERRGTRGGRDSCLEYLHKQYLREVHPWIDQSLLDQLFVSFPMVADFVSDYRSFVEATFEALEERFAGRTAKLGPDLCCIGVKSGSELLDALEITGERFDGVFPRLAAMPPGVDNPISVAVSLSKKKHPFFDHWRFLEKPLPDVSVQIVGSGRAAFRLADRKCIMDALKEAKRSQLHRLAAAARVSESLGKLVLRERDERGIVLPELSEVVSGGLNFESARTLAELMED